jgi:multiple antibiotic resistance protein
MTERRGAMDDHIFHDFMTLFVVINPVGLVPLFIAIAGHESTARRKSLALQAVVIAAAILLAFIAGGRFLLQALGIDVASFRFAGGLVLLLIALRMVMQEGQGAVIGGGAEAGNVAVFPLAMPFIAGPATLMAVVVLTDSTVYSVWQQINTTILLLIVLAITYGCCVSADLLQWLLGVTGANVISRIMGLILAALAVQSMVAAVHDMGLIART